MKLNKDRTIRIFSKDKYLRNCTKSGTSYRWPTLCWGAPVIHGRVVVHDGSGSVAYIFTIRDKWVEEVPITDALERQAARDSLSLLRCGELKTVTLQNTCGPQGVALGVVQDWFDQYEWVDELMENSIVVLKVYLVGDKYFSVDFSDIHNIIVTRIAVVVVDGIARAEGDGEAR